MALLLALPMQVPCNRAAPVTVLRRSIRLTRPCSVRPRATPRTRAGPRDDGVNTSEGQGLYAAAGAAGLAAEAVMFVSLKHLSDYGCGLPPSANGLTSLVEGLSYLGVAGVLGASAYSKVTTGSGLPTGTGPTGYELGPGALLGLAEGVAFLYLLAGVAFLAFAAVNGGLDAVLPAASDVCGVWDHAAEQSSLNTFDPCTYVPGICVR